VQIRELVENIVRALVDSPEQVCVGEIEATHMRVLEIKVAKQDVGYLLGKKGKNIDALRVIVAGAGKGKRCMVEIVGEGRPAPPRICRGKIKRLFEDRNYGFIETEDGRAVYFDASSLKEVDIRSLSLNQQVEFDVEQGPKGFRAVSVVPLTGRSSWDG
jgi:predicted RNA-binding protein YlqC (UPF0109 family)/cold shock CspA family protein